MGIVYIFMLSIALAMDCFAVSIVSGIIAHHKINVPIARMLVMFGIFQAAMPLIGWAGFNGFSGHLEEIDHWIAFLLLLFLGGKMIKDAVSGEEEQHFNPHKLRTQFLLAIATSIDALAVGVSFACLGYHSISQLILPLVMIGITSLILATIGYCLGVKCGQVIKQKLNPELFGGIILIFIGIKVLLSHLLHLE